MAYYLRQPPSPVEPGDVLVRRKHSGLGWHFGTGLSNGLAKDVTPEGGKHITTWEGFLAGEHGFIIRPDRTPYQNIVVEQRALSNIGGGYAGLMDNCEHDANFSQKGVATSPTVNLLGGLAILAATVKIIADVTAPTKRSRR